MNGRLLGACVLVALAVVVAGCGSGATATLAPATPSPAGAAATATSVPAATAVQSAATSTATVAPGVTMTAAMPVTPPVATSTATSVLTATATAVPPTATATALAATATVAPALTATKTVEASSASSTINGQAMTYSYPSGWRLKQETKDRYSVVTLEGPDGALLTLTMYGAEMEPSLLSKSLLDDLTKQFSGATATPLTGKVGGLAAEGYTMKFTYMGVPMTGAILSFRGGKSSFTLYTQATDASLGAVQPGFDLIKNTLVVK